MEVNLDFKEFTESVTKEISQMKTDIRPAAKTMINKSVKLVKSTIESNLPMSDAGATATNYDGTPYVHMRNDVKTSVKDDKDGLIFGIVRGGKYTGYKWHLVNNGTSKTTANHFIDRTMKQVDSEIDSYIDEAIGKVVQGGGQG